MDNTLMSLYDYLGHAAGMELGDEVNKVAQLRDIPARTRQVNNSKYEGKVMLYPKWFLDEYFGNSGEEDDDELPF
jgi:hypothetical protein